ncbi:hypothetical protein RN001_011304 [Aquatica leii]|uniref:Uncharacterized protein n=1 Tax=Aquatica leii TaxID=1421715 RepID=A0AAN7P8Z5_9COLE|nr:hypothetical protein RN001_011304 [Aquatica leii]
MAHKYSVEDFDAFEERTNTNANRTTEPCDKGNASGMEGSITGDGGLARVLEMMLLDNKRRDDLLERLMTNVTAQKQPTHREIEFEKMFCGNLQSKLLECLPQIDLNITPNPITCNQCMITIEEVHEFKQLCMQTEITKLNLRRQIPINSGLANVKKRIQEKLIDDNVEIQPSNLQIITDNCSETTKRHLCQRIPCNDLQIIMDDCMDINTDHVQLSESLSSGLG